ncbi:MAG TPA: polysaccharide deacetylase family protein [Gemmatimonadaceae bacterium]
MTPPASSRPRIAFTLDDGYSDFVTEAMPILAEFDCPITVFLATSVVDRECWYWYDQVTFAFAETRETQLRMAFGHGEVSYSWGNEHERYKARGHLIERLKTIPQPERIEALSRVGPALGVEIPRVPTDAYATMTWDDVKRCAAGGLVTFAPHSMTHPPLDTISAEHSRAEIEGSWARLKAAGAGVVPIFCYPFGAYGLREVEILARSEMVGAVTTEYRYAGPRPFDQSHGNRRFTVPRISYDESESTFLQAVIGLERLKLGLRKGAKGWSPAGAPPEIGARGSEFV